MFSIGGHDGPLVRKSVEAYNPDVNRLLFKLQLCLFVNPDPLESELFCRIQILDYTEKFSVGRVGAARSRAF